jgi:hypothetical protein
METAHQCRKLMLFCACQRKRWHQPAGSTSCDMQLAIVLALVVARAISAKLTTDPMTDLC